MVSGRSRDLVSVEDVRMKVGSNGVAKCSLPTPMPTTSVHIKCVQACSTTFKQHSESNVRVPNVNPEISERYSMF